MFGGYGELSEWYKNWLERGVGYPPVYINNSAITLDELKKMPLSGLVGKDVILFGHRLDIKKEIDPLDRRRKQIWVLLEDSSFNEDYLLEEVTSAYDILEDFASGVFGPNYHDC